MKALIFLGICVTCSTIFVLLLVLKESKSKRKLKIIEDKKEKIKNEKRIKQSRLNRCASNCNDSRTPRNYSQKAIFYHLSNDVREEQVPPIEKREKEYEKA